MEQFPRCTVLLEVHPASAQNKNLISDTDRCMMEWNNLRVDVTLLPNRELFTKVNKESIGDPYIKVLSTICSVFDLSSEHDVNDFFCFHASSHFHQCHIQGSRKPVAKSPVATSAVIWLQKQ